MEALELSRVLLRFNTINPPGGVTIGIDIRTIPDVKHGALVDRLTEYLGPDVALTPIVDVEGVWTDPAHPWMQEIFDLTTPIVGTRPAVRGAPYFTDAAVLGPAYGDPPTVILGPGEMELAHQTDEYCRVDRVEQAVELYVEIARRWCGL